MFNTTTLHGLLFIWHSVELDSVSVKGILAFLEKNMQHCTHFKNTKSLKNLLNS